jgi:hypothetical protein
MSSEKSEYPTVCDLHAALSAFERESRPPFQNLRQGLREIVRRIYSNAPELEQELRLLQRRLGTPDEHPDDMTRVVAIGHELTNMMCLAVFIRGTNKLADPVGGKQR